MSRHRILIVDDDDDARHMLLIALRSHYETVEAHDGLDALSRLEVLEPDLAIIDIMMPTMDGYQVCQAIRKHPKYSSIPVMFLSAYGSKDNAKKSYAVGGNLFMTKPVDPERVLKNIQFTVDHEKPPIRHKLYSVARLEAMRPEEFEALKRGTKERREAPPQPAPEPAEQARAAQSAPEAAPQPAAKPRPARPMPSAGPREGEGRPRVLVVDDDPETRLMVDLSLRDDYEVTKASNGIEAIERMVEFEPDLLLIDIMMPKMNGYQLLQSIRRNPMFGNTPVVVLSAKSARRDHEYAMKLGATDCLAKPYHVNDLLKTVEKIVTAPAFRVRSKTRTIEQIHAAHFREDKDDLDTIQKETSKERLEQLRDSFKRGGDDPFSGHRLE
jgi:CheY-like chemotaxis protein